MTRFATDAVHAGRSPDGDTAAVLTPIHQVSTYAQTDFGVHRGHTYSRASNPTVAALEARLAALEGGRDCVAFASGMAALDAVFRRLSAGDHVVLSEVVYGGTLRLLREVYARHGVTHALVDTTDARAVARAITPETRLVLVETPANPTLRVSDLRAVAAVCERAGVPLAVDNTILTPYAQRPLDVGADLVVHSTTKFLEGHNATIGGAVVVRDDPGWAEWLRLCRKSAGSIMSPFEAWLTLRGIKTLAVRFERHSASAATLAEYLSAHALAARVHYPGLPGHPDHAVARVQQRTGGGIVAFELEGGVDAARRFARTLRIVTLAENLGATESLLTHPATMTHAAYPPEERARLGITDALLRLSVGLEDVVDLVDDVERGLAAAASSGADPVPRLRPSGGSP